MALVACQVVPFLPPPHIDIYPSQPQSSNITIIPKAYTRGQRDVYEASVTWDKRFGCGIWHSFEGDRVVWFGNEAVRRFLAALLSPNECAPCALGVRRARRGPPDVVTSWGPVTELDNRSVLSLLAKCLASVSSINHDFHVKYSPTNTDSCLSVSLVTWSRDRVRSLSTSRTAAGTVGSTPSLIEHSSCCWRSMIFLFFLLI